MSERSKINAVGIMLVVCWYSIHLTVGLTGLVRPCRSVGWLNGVTITSVELHGDNMITYDNIACRELHMFNSIWIF